MVSSAGQRHLLHVFPSFAVGGVENRIVRVINALGDKYRHTIVALDGRFGAGTNLKSELHVALETVRWCKTRFLSLSNLQLAQAALRRIRPALMLTYNWGTTEWAVASRFAGLCPHIHFESGFGPDESPRRQLWRRVMARRLLLARCRQIVVPSMTLYDVASRVWRIPADRLLYLPNGVDCRRFAAPPDAHLLSALSIPDGAPIVGTVAVLRPEKNLLRLIRVFAAIPAELDARLLIVGEGPEGPALQAAAAAAGLADRIVFAGHLSDPSAILGRFDVFVLTSDTEQMPNAVLEAMAAGRAVATTDVGDTKRMLSPENAPFGIPVEDEASLTQAIVRLLKDRALTARIGDANRRRAESQFSLDKMVAGYQKLYATSTAGRCS